MAEKPVLTLSYPQGRELGQLGAYMELEMTISLNSYSTISFKYPFYGANKKESNLYANIQSQMQIKMGQYGNFIITSCEEENNGAERYLSIAADSAEVQLCRRKINLLNGTYKFYDDVNPDDTLLGQITRYVPAWHVGYVSADLMSKYRTFDVPDSTLYDFLMNDVAQTYECIFRFNTIDRTINAYTVSDFTKTSDIFIGYESFLKSSKVEEISDEITTVMSCYGGDGVNIASVNPLGSVFLYDFSHFKSMMSDSLRTAIDKWEQKIEQHRPSYSSLLAQIKDKKRMLIAAEADLKDAQTEKEAQEGVQSAKIAGGKVNDADYNAVVQKIKEAQTKIDACNQRIETLNGEIQALINQQKVINDALKLSTTGGIFTEEDLLELEDFKFESTHQDDNFIITDVMDVVEQQDMMEQLYAQCKTLMAQVAHPTYNITADAANFLFTKKLVPYLENLYDPENPESLKQLLGVKFNLEIAQDEWIEPVLLKFTVNFDDPTKFSMEFSNRYRLNDSTWTYGDLVGEAVSSNGSISFDYSSIKDWSTKKNDLIDFANSSLDATRNKLVNNKDKPTFTVDGTGMRASSLQNQRGIWLTNDTLAFSDDNFETVKTAIGLIPLDNGRSTYGVNAETLIGKAIFGSELTLVNEDNSMTFDGAGLTVENNTNQIRLSPEDGILIKKKSDNSKLFYADTQGNLKLAGFEITKDYIRSTDSAHKIRLNSDGTAQIGMMTVGETSTNFEGNIYAKNIQYGGTAGTLSGGAISSGTLPGGALSDATIGSGKLNVGSLAASGSSFRNAFDSLYAERAEIGQLVANSITSDTIHFKTLRFENQGLIRGTEEYDGYPELRVTGSIYTTQGLRVGRNLVVNGSATILKAMSVESLTLYNNSKYGIGSNGVATFLTTKSTNLMLYKNSGWRTVQVAATAGKVPSNAKVLYIT